MKTKSKLWITWGFIMYCFGVVDIKYLGFPFDFVAAGAFLSGTMGIILAYHEDYHERRKR